MAIKLEDKPNVIAPDADYPFGRIRNRVGSTPGTPVSQEVYGDFHQFFAKMMLESEVIYNDLPDNEYSGFQYFQAFFRLANLSSYENMYRVSQTGAGAPSVANTSSTNLLPFSGISGARNGVGDYEITVPGGFSIYAGAPTAIMLIAGSGSPLTSATETIDCYMQNSKIIIKTYDGGVPTDGILDNYIFTIKILPTP